MVAHMPTIDETLVLYAQPLLASVERTRAARVQALELARMVWNAVVEGRPRDELLAHLGQIFGASAAATALVDVLAARKRSLFADDGRVFAPAF
jgi:hypothetical protein